MLDSHYDGFAGDMISFNTLGERKEQVFPKAKKEKLRRGGEAGK